jgi:TolB protein
MRHLQVFYIGMLTVGLVSGARAVDVQIVKSGAGKAAVDLSALSVGGGPNAAVFKETLASDLRLSGWFTVVAADGTVGVQGNAVEQGGLLQVRAGAVNAATGRPYGAAQTYSGAADRARRLAHQVCDDIVWAVKQKRGIASTRIAAVGSQGARKDLYLFDADGGGAMRVTRDGVVCIAPKWAPDAKSLVYTSFVSGYPDVYRIDIEGGRRERIVDFPGLNSGADISPDGQSIVLTLSKDGNPDLYIRNLRSRQLVRLTRTRHAAEASPAWSPDGRQVVFVSDRSGSPQLYITTPGQNTEKRVTFNGTENVAPDWGPDGRIAYSSRREGRYHLCILDPRSGEQTKITSDYVDHEDPSWAPDARHIVYARTSGYQSDLYILDTLGDPQVRLSRLEGNWLSPAWSPR